MTIPHKVGGILLVAGTCIGAVTLALPISTAPMGFVWTMGVFAISWLAMLLSGWLVLEVNLSMPSGASFVSMARETLGRLGEVITWLCYLLLLYSLLAAYLDGGSDLVRGAWQQWAGHPLTLGWDLLPWALLGAAVLYVGTEAVDRVNSIFVAGLVLSFVLLVVGMSAHINVTRLAIGSPRQMMTALPIVITAFGYQVVIPSLRRYFEAMPMVLPGVIAMGSLVALAVYVIWALQMFGVFPSTGDNSLQSLLDSGHPAGLLPQFLSAILHQPWVTLAVSFFGLFAIASSFVGIALSLMDFLADGLTIQRQGLGRLGLVALTLLPPSLYSRFYPQGFILALSYAGIFVAVLNGVIPVLMAWARRRQAGQDNRIALAYRTPGGWLSYGIVLLFSVAVIIIDVHSHL